MRTPMPAVLAALLALPAAPLAAASLPALEPVPQSLRDVPLPPPPAAARPVPPARVEVAVRRIADQLASGYAKRPSSRYERVAVIDLSETGPGAKERSLGKVVAAELATALRRDHGWLLVERSRIGAVLSELKLAEMGVIEKRVQDVGQLADAQALLIGSVSEAGDRYLVSVRLVSVDRGEALAAASEAIQAASLVALSSDAVVLRSRGDAVYRSALIPGWGQAYNRQPAKAALFGGGVALLLGGALGFQLAGMKAEDDYDRRVTASALGGDPLLAASELRETAETRYAWRSYLLAGAAGLWLLNVGDAWFGGTDGEGMVLGVAPGVGGVGFTLGGRF